MQLSIGMMVKNEEKYLEQCLQALLPILENISSEIIIVDTGSTDSTVAIAQRYTDQVYHHQWSNNFGEMRNIVLSYARGEWFFFLDGDEIIQDASGVIDFFRSQKYKKYNSAFIAINNILEEKNQDNYGLFHALRFFKKDKDFHFKGVIHEQPQAKGPVGKVAGEISHYGYLNDNRELMEYKYQRNVELINKVLREEPDNIYHLFQLSQSYSMYGEKKKSLEPILKAYKLAKAKGLGKYMYVVSHLASIYYHNQLYKEAESIAQEGIKLKDGYLDFYYYQAMSQLEQGKTGEALDNFHRYLELVDKYNNNKGVVDLSTPHKTIQQYEKTYLSLCILYKRIGDYKQALEYANLIENKQIIKITIPHLIDIYIKENKLSAIKELYDKWLQDENLLSIVIQTIEQQRMSMTIEERKQISEMFVHEQDIYGFLNRIRNNDYSDSQLSEILEQIEKIDLNSREIYYGDIIYYLLSHRLPWLEHLIEVKDVKIAGFINYLLQIYDEFKDYLIDYLEQEIGDITDGNTLRILTTVCNTLLRVGNLKAREYENIFKAYINAGTKYIGLNYHPNVIAEERVSWAKTNADAFLLYMAKAEQVKEDKANYIKYLRMALKQDETMKQGIELLLAEIQKSIEMPQNQEFEAHKQTVLEAIGANLNAGDLETAKVLIKEYENIVGTDAKICSAKAVVLMVERKLEGAKEVLLEGLKLEPSNSDLLYNLGYLYEQKGEIDKANYYYSKSK